VLINANFAKLWLARTLSVLGDYIFNTTLVVWIAADLGKGQSWSALAVSGLLAAAAVPTVLVGPLAGVFVDRWARPRRTMVAANLLSALAVLALLPLTGLVRTPLGPAAPPLAVTLPAIFAVVFVISVLGQFSRPSAALLVLDLVPEASQPRAFGLNQTSTYVAILLGPPLAAPLLFAFGARWALLINAASFLAALLLIRGMREIEEGAPSTEVLTARSVLGDFAAGLRFFVGSRTLTTIAGTVAIVMVGQGALSALDIFFVTENLGAPAKNYGYLTGAEAVGMIAGSLGWGLLAPRIGLRRLFCGGLVGVGLGIVAYAQLTHFGAALVLLACVGLFSPAINVALTPMLMRVTPRAFVGRVFATLDPILTLAAIAGTIAGGALYSSAFRGFHARILGVAFGPLSAIFTGAGLLCLLGGLLAARLLPAENDPPGDETVVEA